MLNVVTFLLIVDLRLFSTQRDANLAKSGISFVNLYSIYYLVLVGHCVFTNSYETF